MGMMVEGMSGAGGVSEDKDHLKPLSPSDEPAWVRTCKSKLPFCTLPSLRGCCPVAALFPTGGKTRRR